MIRPVGRAGLARKAPPGWAAGAAALMLLAALPACADTVHVVTERGNVFSSGDGGEAGSSALDGLGISSRLVHHAERGTLVHASSGSGLSGTEVSLRPYVRVPADAPFAFLASEAEALPVPRFYRSYSISDGSLSEPSPAPNVLGYSASRALSGSVRAEQQGGIAVSGEGRLVLRLEPHGGPVVISGELSEGTTARLATSPYDLAALPYELSRGFLIYSCACDPGPSSISAEAGSVPDSEKSGTLEYDRKIKAEWYVGKCCRIRYTTEAAERVSAEAALAVLPANARGYLVVAGERTEPEHLTLDDIRRPWARHYRTHYDTVGNFAFSLYDTLPVRSHSSFSGDFEQRASVPPGAYLVVDSAGGSSKLRAHAAGDGPALSVSGAPPETGYRVSRGGTTLASGLSSASGEISVPAFAGGALPGAGGTLHLYGSPTYVRSGERASGTVVFDPLNGQVVELDDGVRDRLYVVHAYAKVPVTGGADVSGVSLDGRVQLPYLSGRYEDGDSLMVPVVPARRTIQMEANGVGASLDIADVLGGTGLRIADPVTSAVSVQRPGAFVSSVEATAGAVSYLVAQSDGTAKAHVRASVSGSSEITNTRTYQGAPPPPPPPAPRDPLTTWLRVYVNGEPVRIGGEESVRIFFSDSPVESHESGAGSASSYHTARFSYPEIDVFETVSVPVREADFVEFYFYSRVRAEGSAPPQVPGLDEIRRDGRAEAVSVLRHASIQAGM